AHRNPGRPPGRSRCRLRKSNARGRRGRFDPRSSWPLSPFAVLLLADEDALDLAVSLERRPTELPPEPALLDAAERRLDEHAAAAVDGEDPRLDGTGDPQRSPDVSSPERAGQTVGAVVGDRDRLFLVLEWDRDDDRTEDLLLRDPHAVLDPSEDRRRQEAPRRKRGIGRFLSPAEPLGPLAIPDLDVIHDSRAMNFRDERSHLGVRGERVSDSDRPCSSGQIGDEAVVDRLLNQEARARAAVLPGVVEHAPESGGEARLDI